MYKDKRILILGAGQIGEACAMRFIKDKPREIVLHTLTEEEASRAIKNINDQVNSKGVKMTPSWGNILVPIDLIYTKRSDLLSDEKNLDNLLKYYYACLNDKLIENSALYQIIKKWNPDLIIDSINTATVVGYLDDPYSLPRNLIKDFTSKEAINWKTNCKKVLFSAIIPSLIRFTQVIQKSLKDFQIGYYVKVSTTGLGGMGINLMYTHGDINEPGMSSGILGKVAAAGVFHQLMWSLSHTPGNNIRVITPAALVGWQPVGFGKFRSHGINWPLIDNKEAISLKEGELLKANKNGYRKVADYMEIPFVDSGENSAYSLYEMYAITALGQMESITREEVAQAVYECSCGSTKHDLLTAMDNAALGPTYAGFFNRNLVLDHLKEIVKTKKIPSIATNNLGPTVSKHLFELYILFDIFSSELPKILNQDSEIFAELAEKYVLKNDIVRQQAISLGLPIIFEKNKLTAGDHYFVPNMAEENIITKRNIDKWANAGWIDLRKKNIKNWQNLLKKAYDGYLKQQNSSLDHVIDNYHAFESKNIGEILGLIYCLQGGARRK